MKTKLYLMIVLFVMAVNSYGQQSSSWSKWSWMIGEWKGVGSGEPGRGSGSFSFKADLKDKILVRKAHSEYPATANKPAIVHDDLLIVYLDASGDPSRAIYFDNEGHTINYSISYTGKSIVMLGDKTSNAPIFRLTYTLLENDTVNVKFEMSQDGEKFTTYVEGKCKRAK
jgi:hypothetical protein